jgi:sorbitol/mannitol transport system permease protein
MTTLATPSAPTVPGRVRGPRAARSATKPGSTSTRRGTAIAGVVAWVVALLFFFPVLWMVLTSFHSEPDAAGNPPKLFAPLTLDGYRTFFGAASGASPWPPLINSAEASVVSTLLVLCLAVPAAYALAVKPVRRWTDVMFFFLSTKMLPVVAGLLPLYIIATFALRTVSSLFKQEAGR